MVWRETWHFYKQCSNNQDFLSRWTDQPLMIHDGQSFNTDMVESSNPIEELTNLYKNQQLVAFRPGCVETSFVYFYLFREQLKLSHLNKYFLYGPLDGAMRTNAGMYYQNVEDKERVHRWYADSFVSVMQNCTPTFCYLCLYHDLLFCARLGLKKKFYDYSYLVDIILKNSAGKKILYIGSAVDSIKASYERGVARIWKFDVPHFDLYTVKTPQTTAGVSSFPHSNMIETTEDIVEKISEIPDFDTALLGCGAYGAPLIDSLRQRFPNKNLMYLGSDCYKMFGIISEHMRWDTHTECNREFLTTPTEKSPDPNHPEPKYWRKS